MKTGTMALILAGTANPWLARNLHIIVPVLIVAWGVLGAYVFREVKKTYARGGVFTNRLLGLWFVVWGLHHLALILSSLYGRWPMPLGKTPALAGGVFLIAGGVVILAAGMIEFRTWRRSCGQDTTKLVTTGIYRWSRNPQFMGCLLYLSGISLLGRSGLAFALTATASLVIYWYTVRLAEPYLGRLYGEEYDLYKTKVARWVGTGRAAK